MNSPIPQIRTVCMLRALSLIAATVLSVAAGAQEVGYIDTRSGSQTEKKVVGGSGSGGNLGCGAGCVPQKTLKVEIVKLVALDLTPTDVVQWTEKLPDGPDQQTTNGEGVDNDSLRTVEWTIRIINTSQHIVFAPSSLSWSADSRPLGAGQTIRRLSISAFTTCFTGSTAQSRQLLASVSLYSPVDNSTDSISIGPGEWITVVGRGAACPRPTSGNDEYEVTTGLDLVNWSRKEQGYWEDTVPIIGFTESPSIDWNGEGTWNPPNNK
jgi:hypothetical protein